MTAAKVFPMDSIELAPPSTSSSGRRRSKISIHHNDVAKTAEDTGSGSYELNDEITWIQRFIKRRECIRFTARNPQEAKGPDTLCQCGHTWSQHVPEAQTNTRPCEKWSKDTHTRSKTTNAFGEIEFPGSGDKVGKYVRVDIDTDMNRMLTLMMEKWGLEKPNLLISVTGGAKNFHMKARLKEVFRRGLMKAALSTGAWIITGGTNAGVMKHVGEAVRDFGLTAEAQGKVIAIGIAPWGCIQTKNELVNENCTGKWPAVHRIVKEQKKKESFLDPNHSHFVLVDNGTQHQFAVEIPFRGKLENAIANIKTDTGQDAVTVPVALLVLEGGPGTLETCNSAISNNTPAVIIKGSGRAADILAKAYQNSREEEIDVTDKEGKQQKESRTIIDAQLESEITKMIKEDFGEDNLSQRVGWVRECLQNRDMITIFELDSRNSTSDVDVAILKALLKANKNQVMDQLKLALAWNRIDIAKSEIFTDERQWPSGVLDDVMLSAIQLNRVDFVDLFLDHGLNLQDFLTVKRMLYLYNNVPRNCLLHQHLSRIKESQRVNFSLADVGVLFQDLLGDYYQPYYLTQHEYKYLDVDLLMGDAETSVKGGIIESTVVVGSTACSGAPLDPQKALEIIEFHRPAQELFTWSVLLNRQGLAKLFWREGNEQTAAALVANSLLKALKSRTDDTELLKKFQDNADEFENLAIGVINTCYNSDEKRAHHLLIRELPYWGVATCVLIAVQADNKRFVSQTACQTLLNNIWKGQLSQENSTFMLVPSIFIFPLVWVVIKFKLEEKAKLDALALAELDGKKSKQKTKRDLSTQYSREPTMMTREPTKINLHEKEPRKKQTKLSPFQKLALFYTAPVTIFYLNVISYLVFLGLYSYILLVHFNKTFSVYEGILICWVFTIFVEEIRQIVTNNATSIKSKVSTYFTDSWNILDMITIVLFSTGMVLRFIPNDECFEAARVILCLNLVSFFFRILHIFSVHKQLGPKLVMIRRMLQDLSAFVIILMVFIVAYAIASEAILYPNTTLDVSLLYYILRKAYWTIYGELFLDEIEGTGDCTNDPQLYADHSHLRCPTSVGKKLVPILMAIYIMLTNVLLLNLLIAMFSYTFQHIQDNTDLHWYFQRFQLITEYYSRPALPPPLIVLSQIAALIRYLFSKCWTCVKSSSDLRKKYENKLEEKQLVQWENIIADTFLSKIEMQECDSVDHKVSTALCRLNIVLAKVDEIQDMHPGSGQPFSTLIAPSPVVKLPPQLEQRLNGLEEQMIHTYKALDWIMKSLTEHNMGAKTSAPKLPDLEKKREDEKRKKEEQMAKERDLVQKLLEKRIKSHFKSRTSPYLGSHNVHRFPVPDEKVLWEISYPEYEPVIYTSPGLKGKAWADPVDLMTLTPAQRMGLTFNDYDNKYHVDRRSFLGTYQVKDGLPLNPVGRTGITGRGSLGRWGPNHAGDPVVTRWKLDSSGNKVLSSDNKPVLEFVAVQRSDNKNWALPGQICNPTTPVWEILKTEFSEEALGTLMDDPNEKDKILEKLKQLSETGVEVYRGYADDPRNTDNTWIESRVVHYHDEDGSILQHFVLRAGELVEAATWQTLSSAMSLHGAHSYFLKIVAKKLNAAF